MTLKSKLFVTLVLATLAAAGPASAGPRGKLFIPKDPCMGISEATNIVLNYIGVGDTERTDAIQKIHDFGLKDCHCGAQSCGSRSVEALGDILRTFRDRKPSTTRTEFMMDAVDKLLDLASENRIDSPYSEAVDAIDAVIQSAILKRTVNITSAGAPLAVSYLAGFDPALLQTLPDEFWKKVPGRLNEIAQRETTQQISRQASAAYELLTSARRYLNREIFDIEPAIATYLDTPKLLLRQLLK
jgi:hypothetical protein